MTRQERRRGGLSLIEVMAALIIAATVAALSIHYLRPANTAAQQRSCDLQREILQNDLNRYREATSRMPAVNLRQLRTKDYSGTTLPTCPVTGEQYRRNAQGIVYCRTHERTRQK